MHPKIRRFVDEPNFMVVINKLLFIIYYLGSARGFEITECQTVREASQVVQSTVDITLNGVNRALIPCCSCQFTIIGFEFIL